MSDNTQSTLKWTPHVIVDRLIPPLSTEQVKAWLKKPEGYNAALSYWKRHEAMITDAAVDPLRKGFELPFWQDFREFLSKRDELYALGGNGPGKTEIGGKVVAEKLCGTAGMRTLCVAQNDNASKQLQQPAVYKYLPPAARGLNERLGPRRRSMVTKINYSQGGGFTESTFVLPNRSQCWFKTVEQWERDNTSFEGPEYDLVWIDEPAPVGLVHTLSYRVGKRRGKFLFTFTAVNGFDAVCKSVLTGARVLKSMPMNWVWRLPPESGGFADPEMKIPELELGEVQVKGLPAGHMPYMMQPLDPTRGVIFLWTQWNVFLPRAEDNPKVPSLFVKCRGKSQQTVRTRLFGWAEKISGCQFPQFNTNVHVVKNLPEEGTVYCAADPATARSYFVLWAVVDPAGRKFVYDESPRFEDGEWVNDEEGRGDGTRVFAGKGVNFYKEHIRRREDQARLANPGWSQCMRRKGDPRAFATESAARNGGQTLFELFMNEADEPNDALHAPMYFEPAKVRQTILLDLEKINNDFSYDEDRPVSVENEPRLFIHERCHNLIRALIHWSPDQGADSPWKDPIDTLRYLCDEPLHFINPDVPDIVGGKGW